jgi:HK97 family phage portal protein
MISARQLLARGLRSITRAVEGEVRPGPYQLPITGGWLPDGAPSNWWQLGMDPSGLGSASAMVEACVSAYSQTVAMCTGDHWRANNKGGRDRVKNSALSRILRTPNSYQTSSDFMLNATRQLYLDGNAYALALRNDRYEVTELHLMDSNLCKPMVAPTGDVFYRLGGNMVVQQYLVDEYPILVPQRDVLHIRMHADRRYPFPLWGQSPLLAAVNDLTTTGAITSQQINFYLNQARPAAVISTDLDLDIDQVQALQDRWDERSKGLSQGKTPVLTHGLKVVPWSAGGRDSQLAEILKYSNQNIALVFRIPLALLGLGGTAFGSTEALMQFWVSTGLGFTLNHIEQAFDRLFQLKGEPDEYTELSTAALLRSAMKDRIEALKEGVMGGIYSPNEARNLESLDSVPYGDSPRVQQQVVPLEAAAGITPPGAAGAASGPHPPPAPPASGQPSAAPINATKPKPPPPKASSDDIRRETQRLLNAASRIQRPFT